MSPPRPLAAFFRPSVLLSAFAGTAVYAGDFTAAILDGDSNSGINAGLTYLSKADLNGGATTINGVGFTDTGLTGAGYALGGAFNGFTGYGNSVSGALNAAATNFFYNGDGSGNNSLTFSGLVPGTQYVASLYNVSFGGNRFVDITPSDTGVPLRFNEDANVSGAGNVLRYAYTGPAGGTLTLSFDAVSNGDSYHFYGLTNAVRNDAIAPYTHFTPVTPVITRSSGVDSPFTVSNTDLLQTNLGSMTTTGNFNREPVLGAPSVLANGAFSIGVGANRPQLVTGENNSSVTFNLDTSVNTLGYDVTSITGFGGWGDAGRDQQSYSVFFSVVGSADYTLYGQINDNPVAPGSLSAIQAVFTGSVSGVDAVKVVFLDGVENGFVGYGEFDVIGTATVPEPGSVGLLLLGALGLVSRRRKA